MEELNEKIISQAFLAFLNNFYINIMLLKRNFQQLKHYQSLKYAQRHSF